MSLHGVTRKDSARRARVRQGGAIRRARERAAAGDEKPLTLDELYAVANGYCCHCRRRVPREKATIEHVVALANGGTDTPDNQAMSCRSCNSKKGARRTERKKELRRTPLRRKPRALPDDVF